MRETKTFDYRSKISSKGVSASTPDTSITKLQRIVRQEVTQDVLQTGAPRPSTGRITLTQIQITLPIARSQPLKESDVEIVQAVLDNSSANGKLSAEAGLNCDQVGGLLTLAGAKWNDSRSQPPRGKAIYRGHD